MDGFDTGRIVSALPQEIYELAAGKCAIFEFLGLSTCGAIFFWKIGKAREG